MEQLVQQLSATENPPIVKCANNTVLVNIDDFWHGAVDSHENDWSRGRSYNKFLELENVAEYKDQYLLVDVPARTLMVGDTEAVLLPKKTETSYLGLVGAPRGSKLVYIC